MSEQEEKKDEKEEKKKKKKEKKEKKEASVVTKESFAAVFALFSLLAFLILCTGSLVFGSVIGGSVQAFLLGVLGYAAYPALVWFFFLSVRGLFGKKKKEGKGVRFCLFSAIVCALLLTHAAMTYSFGSFDFSYVNECFKQGNSFLSATVFGWIGALLVFLLSSLTTKIGAIVVYSALVLFFGYLAFISYKKRTTVKTGEETVQQPAPQVVPQTVETPTATHQEQPQPTEQPQVAQPAPQATGYDASAYGYGGESMPQRPAFTLGQEMPTQTGGNGFSPFSGAQTAPTDDPDLQSSYENSRDFLFGVPPEEHLKRNLIFDPNSSVNRRPPVGANPAPSGGQSYSEAYQTAVNEGGQPPLKVFDDRSQEPQAPAPTQTPAPSIPPAQPITPPPIEPQSTVSYPVYEDPTPTRTYVPSVEEEERGTTQEPTTPIVDDPRVTIHVDEPTPTEETGGRSEEPYRRHDYMDIFSPENPNVFGNDDAGRETASRAFSGRSEAPFTAEEGNDRDGGSSSEEDGRRDGRTFSEEDGGDEPTRERSGIDIFDEEEDEPYEISTDFGSGRRGEEDKGDRFGGRDVPEEDTNGRGAPRAVEEPRVAPPQPTPPPPPPPKPRVIRPYVRPHLDDFDCRDVEPSLDMEEVQMAKENIIATLEDFKVIGATIASVTFGPTVTRYNVTLPRNISHKKVVALDQEIAISLHSSGVNIYPNYEDGAVSIEVPNRERQFVQLGCMLTGDTYVNAKSSSIMFAMGKDVGNRKVYGDISKMTHMLVAGSSGSGKSVFLGSLIISLIYKYSPEELRLILIDPKMTEFVLYNSLPHLMINEIITDANKAVQSLNWAIGEMNRRYALFEQMSRAGTYVVNLDQYNAHIEKNERLPKIVIIIDELADLMLKAKKDIEDRIQNLTQKARAAGIHLVVATQRPSTDVITGVIKSNLPTRIAFAVATDVDSRVILDQTGAQKLLGKGDFLYTMQGINTPVRVQSAFISAEDSQRVVNFIKANNEAYYDESATAYINNTRSGGSDSGSFGGSGDEIEPVYIDALRHVILSNSASISLIQRKCSIGYNKAGKIVEWMEEMGYISSFEGAKARKVLITKEEFESKYGTL